MIRSIVVPALLLPSLALAQATPEAPLAEAPAVEAPPAEAPPAEAPPADAPSADVPSAEGPSPSLSSTTDPAPTIAEPAVSTETPIVVVPPAAGPLEAVGLTPTFDGRLYGYIETFFEQDAATPIGVDAAGNTIFQDNPYEWDIFNLHAMVQGTVFGRFRYFLNFASPKSGSVIEDAPLLVRNAWVEAPLFGDLLNVRVGKTYRRFGLYNEILDAAPTFIGIEPPEIFDNDHLMLTRTTNLMLHGRLTSGDSLVSYALMTGNDEKAGFQIPLGADLSYEYGSTLKIGTSFYWTGGPAGPSRDIGEGSPAGGVVNWMAKDEYVVVGGYSQLTAFDLTLQLEGWVAPHTAERDPDRVLALVDAGLNPRQLERFGLDVLVPDKSDVPVKVQYVVATFYARAGYSLLFQPEGWAEPLELVPYAQFDYFSNPEIVANKDFGGDNEAGLSDDGVFYKATLGVVFRPVPAVALKIDGSTHTQLFNEEWVTYPEVRVSFSYFWELGGLR